MFVSTFSTSSRCKPFFPFHLSHTTSHLLFRLVMAPNTEKTTTSSNPKNSKNIQKPSRLSMEGLQRTISDISYELTKENIFMKEENDNTTPTTTLLPPISEVEDAKCECCGMSEECTPEYISRVRSKFSGKLLCGICAEAVNEEMEKNGRSRDEAVHAHMSACVKFNRIGRSHPVLYQAEAVREILKKSSRIRAKSMSPKESSEENHRHQRKGGIARSSSCMPAIAKEIGDQTMVT